MPVHLQREIENLKKKLLTLSVRVEATVREATLSIENRDYELAQKIIQNDPRIDKMEVGIEEDCLKILALHQPVAIDLRFIVAVLKINNELERIGDLAVNIAERSAFLSKHPPVGFSLGLIEMVDKVQEMLKHSLDALIGLSSSLAQEVCASDDAVDAMNRQMYIKIQDAIRNNPEHMESLIHLLSVSRHLERIADHATNIAEDIIYMVEGQIARHRTEDYK
ncbi:MAG: phosphate signaling complex protein PhoU [Sedimentisphaerales bacterium]|jgi:phosphate transport system protein